MRFRACWVTWKLWLMNQLMTSPVKEFRGRIILKKRKLILMCWGLSWVRVSALIQIGKRVGWCTRIVMLLLNITGKKLEIMKLLVRMRNKLCRVTKISQLNLILSRLIKFLARNQFQFYNLKICLVLLTLEII